MNAMGSAYEGYLRNSRKLTGLELQLIRGRTNADNANLVVNQVHDSYQNWETKNKDYYKFKPGVGEDYLKGAVLILGELVMANFLPWFGGVNELVDKLPKTCDEMQLCITMYGQFALHS